MTVARAARPRIVMFVHPRVPFGHDWADAASIVADVVRLEVTAEPVWAPLPAYPALARDPADPASYQLRRATRLPWRLLGRLSDEPAVRRAHRAVRHVEAEHGPVDLLHAHFYPAARYFPALSRRVGVPYVVTEHSTALTLESPDKAVTPRGLRIAATVYREAAAVLPVSRSLLDAITALGLTGRFTVVANPVDPTLFAPPAVHRGRRDPVRLVTVARLEAVKGIDVLLHAVADCRARGLPVHLTVVGAGTRRGDLEALRARLGLDGAVELAGRRSREEIAERLRRADVFVLASRAENLPVAGIEALMSGLPVVATAVGGLPELVGEGAGRLVAPDDAPALARALRETVEGLDRHDRQAVAAAARRRYSAEAVARSLDRVYRDALAVGARAPTAPARADATSGGSSG